MNKYKLCKWMFVIVLLEAACAEVQPEDAAPTPTEHAEAAGPGVVMSISLDPAASNAELEPAELPDIEVEAETADLGEDDADAAPAFHDSAAPEQPTLRQVLESMQPPALTDDESVAGSVWLHSKAGPDMAELTDSEQPPLTSSGQEEPDDTEHPQDATAVEGSEGATVAADNSTSNSTVKLCSCLPLNRTEEELTVTLVNGSVLSEALVADSAVRSRSQPAVCLLVLFYGRTCPFSAAAAPHVNALPRAFPDLRVLAVDALENGSLNTRFGIIAVPTVLLFHNGRPQARFNQSEPTLSRLAEFVTAYTQLPAAGELNVTAADREGPLPAEVEQRLDWYLVAAWLFIAVCAAYAATRLRLWRRAADNVRNWWIEAEQHLHEE